MFDPYHINQHPNNDRAKVHLPNLLQHANRATAANPPKINHHPAIPPRASLTSLLQMLINHVEVDFVVAL